MRAEIILWSIGHKCLPKKKKRFSPVVRDIELSIIAHSRLLQRKEKEPQMGGKRAACGTGAAGCRPLN